MTRDFMQSLLDSGEGFTIEYKRNENKLSSDVFETVSSFSNRYGGHILLGVIEVERNGHKVGQVAGVDKDRIYDMKRDFINILNNPSKFKPTLYLELEEFEYDGETVLWTYVPPTSGLCYCDRKIYDRVGDADQNITDKNDRVAEMISRKSADYREQQILPYANETHLQMDLMDRVRKMVNGRDKDHPWINMDNMEIMRSAGLYVENIATGEKGFNLAAILLFGKPEVIKSCVPGYKTDAIYREMNIDRYDDRDIVDVNLIEAYDRLMAFCRKHMDNRFVLDGDISIDARELIAREVVGNILIHRDYTNAFPAKLIIEKGMLRTENWSKSRFNGPLRLDTYSPYPKNPLLASFFVNIGRADTLGSGMRNLYKYTKMYSHAEPMLIEGDVFEIRVPISNNGNDANNEANQKQAVASENADIQPISSDISVKNDANNEANQKLIDFNAKKSIVDLDKMQINIITEILKNPRISQEEIAKNLSMSRSTVQRTMKSLVDRNIIVRNGGTRGYWDIKQE